jgi:hypothetical protein
LGLAVQAWNLLGGVIDYTGLPIVAELLGVADIERLIYQLVLIRDRKNTH